MKQYKKVLCGVFAFAAMVACTDDHILTYDVEKPLSVIAMEYVNKYDALKTYIDRTANPDFKLGTGVSVSDYISKNIVYRLTNANYDEMTAGWEMKHMAIVQNNGTMDFSTVENFVEVANDAGTSIFGHTLCWHANQNATYLNTLLEPTIIPGTGGGGNGGHAYTFTNTAAGNFWESQVCYDISPDLINGTQYTLKFMIRATANGTIRAEIQSSADYSSDSFGTFNVSKDWEQYELTTTATASDRNRMIISFGDYEGTVYIDNVTLCPAGSNQSIITNGDFENGAAGWGGWGGNASCGLSDDGEGYSSGSAPGYAYWFENTVAGNFWEAQEAYNFATYLDNDTEYILKFVVKATAAGSLTAEIQSSSDYSSNSFGSFNVTKEWQEYELSTYTSAANRDRFIINFGNYEGRVYIDNITLCPAGSSRSIITNSDFEEGTDGWGGWGGNSSRGLSELGEGYGGTADQVIEKTDEEKAEIITGALETWIAGMMEVTKDHVTAWDVVNEPMSDWPDQTQLKTGEGKELSSDEFYWQDYMGKDYARKAIEFTRKHGNGNELLFINDYGLEGGGQKCRGLIDMIKYWESDGVTRIDGIGTQMHVNLKLDPVAAAEQEENIIKMFQLLASTGKLIKISELDMGILKEDNLASIKTVEAEEEHLKAQSDLYEFIVKAYFEYIPSGQRYGITHWAPTDSPESSSWRGGEPIGLWTLDYNRKHAYAGFANGLANKTIFPRED